MDSFRLFGPDTSADGITERLEAIEEALNRIELTGTETRNLVEKGISQVLAVVSEIQGSLLQGWESNDSQALVLIALQNLESRMIRTEKGLVRTLEYFESRLAAQTAAARSSTGERPAIRD